MINIKYHAAVGNSVGTRLAKRSRRSNIEAI
jgi:hypothetical protein